MIIADDPETVSAFVASLIPGCERGWANCKALGFVDGGALVAGVVYHNWSPEMGVIELSAASVNRSWLTRDRLKAIFGYPFDQLRCRIAIARISEHNARARRIWRSLGALEYTLPELRSPTEAEILYMLHERDWRSNKLSR